MNDARLIHADVRDGLDRIEPASVQCVVTSPPYWGLRDYNTATWSGGDPECDHRHTHEQRALSRADTEGRATIPGGGAFYGDTCGRCGATRHDPPGLGMAIGR